MDKLDKIFMKQLKLQEQLVLGDKLFMNQEYININILAIIDELSECLRETAWKNPNKIKYGWKKSQQFNLINYKLEIVDLLHFFINLCLSAGLSSKELFSLYNNKNKINIKRKKDGY